MKSSKELTKPKKISLHRNRLQAKICIYVFEQRVYKTLAPYVQKSFSNNRVLHNYSWFRKTESRILLGVTFFFFRGFHWITLCIFL